MHYELNVCTYVKKKTMHQQSLSAEMNYNYKLKSIRMQSNEKEGIYLKIIRSKICSATQILQSQDIDVVKNGMR